MFGSSSWSRAPPRSSHGNGCSSPAPPAATTTAHDAARKPHFPGKMGIDRTSNIEGLNRSARQVPVPQGATPHCTARQTNRAACFWLCTMPWLGFGDRELHGCRDAVDGEHASCLAGLPSRSKVSSRLDDPIVDDWAAPFQARHPQRSQLPSPPHGKKSLPGMLLLFAVSPRDLRCKPPGFPFVAIQSLGTS
ncbi:hypothetical protein VUR80DRAFT_10082 [Thermomyces stellatus]